MEGTIAEIRFFCGNFAPRNWAYCNGQLLAISQNTALFSVIGTIYGGDGRTTFALPDLRGRVALGSGNGPGLPDVRQGARSGTETNTLTIQTMPNHTHTASLAGNITPRVNSGTDVDSDDPSDAFVTAKGTDSYAGGAEAGAFGGTLSSNKGFTVAQNGSQQAMNNLQPFLTVNYVICLQGVYPSRS